VKGGVSASQVPELLPMLLTEMIMAVLGLALFSSEHIND
jgi:hypothetical protein